MQNTKQRDKSQTPVIYFCSGLEPIQNTGQLYGGEAARRVPARRLPLGAALPALQGLGSSGC